MATIDSKPIIDAIIRGEYDDDLDIAVKIVEYTNDWGRVTWGVVFQTEALQDRYERPSPFIHNPKVIWERGHDHR